MPRRPRRRRRRRRALSDDPSAAGSDAGPGAAPGSLLGGTGTGEGPDSSGRGDVRAAAVAVPPHRKAKDMLRGASELMSDPYRFCSLVSDVLRTYVEERFELRAPERTTEEFMDELHSSHKLHVEHKTLLEDFLSRCDLVKFARFEPTIPELEGLLDSAVRFIDETAPMDQPQDPQPQQGQAA